jgi:hypothetical protein
MEAKIGDYKNISFENARGGLAWLHSGLMIIKLKKFFSKPFLEQPLDFFIVGGGGSILFLMDACLRTFCFLAR